VVVDMPFGSYEQSKEQAFASCARVLKETTCGAIKLEGGVRMAPRMQAMTDAGIAVMGHIGLTPQYAGQLGGYRVQGKTLSDYRALLADAKALEAAGVFAILMEAIPRDVAARIAQQVKVPCYGIGAGKALDGQLMIVHDMLGMFVGEVKPRFVKHYADIGQRIVTAMQDYAKDVRKGVFPAVEHEYSVDAKELKLILADKKR
jgi:3-methyl-2-oxobutanoate hydroxymethyltransferase